MIELTGGVAVRKGPYKLVGEVQSSRADWKQTAAELEEADLELYDLETDIGESRDVCGAQLSSCLPSPLFRHMSQNIIS